MNLHPSQSHSTISESILITCWRPSPMTITWPPYLWGGTAVTPRFQLLIDLKDAKLTPLTGLRRQVGPLRHHCVQHLRHGGIPLLQGEGDLVLPVRTVHAPVAGRT